MNRYALIVDDDAYWRDLIARAVERLGLESDPAANSYRAIDLIKRRPHAIALLDADLGSDQGFSACTEILAELRANGSGVPTVIVSGQEDVHALVKGFAKHYPSIRGFSKSGGLLELESLICDLCQIVRDDIDESMDSRIKNGKTVFIGHGRSLAWRELKDFVCDRLDLQFDEFNRISAAGIATTNRLSEMLSSANFAFLVLTAEDERLDGKMVARQNVVHEVGLFQGRLGFSKAIVLLEQGCEEFSNIHGLGQLRFPQGDIKAVFEEVRQVLEREGIVGK